MNLSDWKIIATSAVGFNLGARAIWRCVEHFKGDVIADVLSSLPSDGARALLRRDFILYTAAAAHATVITAWSAFGGYRWLLLQLSRAEHRGKGLRSYFFDPKLTNEALDPTDECRTRARKVLLVMFGFFLQDILFLYGTLRKDVPMTMHHVLGLLLTFYFGALASDDGLMALTPMLSVVEGSTIFLDLSWLLFKLRESGAAARCRQVFAVLFLALRVLHMPAFIGWVNYSNAALFGRYPVVSKLIYAVTGLQFVWAWQIVKKVVNRDF